MKGGVQVALAVGVGYILGRRRKMRMATVIAIGAASGGIGGLGPAVLKRGAKMLSSTDLAGTFGPQVNEIVDTIRGDLLDAGKAAATTAVSSRMDSLSDTLHERAEAFRNPEAAVAGAGKAAGKAGETVGRAGGSVGRLRRRRPAEDEDESEQDSGERGNGRSRSGGRRAARAESDEADEAYSESDEYEDEEPYEDEVDEPDAVDEIDEDEADEADEADEPAPRRTRRSRSPVARTRR
jgi:hypothetical protein